MDLLEQRMACLRMAIEMGCKADTVVVTATALFNFLGGQISPTASSSAVEETVAAPAVEGTASEQNEATQGVAEAQAAGPREPEVDEAGEAAALSMGDTSQEATESSGAEAIASEGALPNSEPDNSAQTMPDQVLETAQAAPEAAVEAVAADMSSEATLVANPQPSDASEPEAPQQSADDSAPAAHPVVGVLPENEEPPAVATSEDGSTESAGETSSDKESLPSVSEQAETVQGASAEIASEAVATSDVEPPTTEEVSKATDAVVPDETITPHLDNEPLPAEAIPNGSGKVDSASAATPV
jgi:hypothetical protein